MGKFLPFQRYFCPETLEEALRTVEEERTKLRVLAGGTDILVAMREKGLHVESLVDIKRISELKGIQLTDDGKISIGATTTLYDLENNTIIRQYCPVLAEAAGTIGSLQVRYLGTIGGNLANGSPAADTAPALMVLGADLELVSRSCTRVIPVDGFFKGPGQTALQRDEILRRILVPVPPSGVRAIYLKFGPRKAMDIAVVGVGISLIVNGDGDCVKAMVALGSVAPTPIRARNAETVLLGKIDERRMEEAALKAVAETRPIDDVRASASYRMTLVHTLLKRAIQQAMRGSSHEKG